MIYLDNAATTFPKPRSVYKALEKAVKLYGGNPGRGSHLLSREASKLIYDCREEIASMFDGKPENVVFTMNATHAINTAFHALKRNKGVTLLSSFEHNAVYRTAAAYGGYYIFEGCGNDLQILYSFMKEIEKKPSLVVCNHVSNICGAVMPVERIGNICYKKGIPFIIDASQSAGRRRLSLKETKADAICAPGHKGLYGIQGCGFVIFSDKYSERANELNTFIYGGNGVNSLESVMPDFLPERLEAGTPSTPAIASLCAGIKEVKRLGIESIEERESKLGKRLTEGLSVVSGIELYGSEYMGGTVLFNKKGIPSERLGEMLDNNGICIRAGYHCCPLGHSTLKTPEGGAVRVSFSFNNTEYDVDRLLRVMSRK